MQAAPTGEFFTTGCGNSITLSVEEEKQLVKHCMYMARIDCGFSRTELTGLANEFDVSLNEKTPDPVFEVIV